MFSYSWIRIYGSKSEIQLSKMNCLLILVVLTASLIATSEPKKGYCKHPAEFTNVNLTAETYMVQTKVRYRCDHGFNRVLGSSGYYVCTDVSGKIAWKGRPLQCKKSLRDNAQLSTDFQRSWAFGNGSGLTDRCGLLPNISHAFLNISYSIYQEGQEFHYNSNHVQAESHGVIKCMYCNGLITWVNMTEGCIPSRMTVSWITEDVTEYLHTETTRGMMTIIQISVLCTAFGAVITIILCSIFGKKKWRKRFPGKVKAVKQANENKSNLDVHLHLNDSKSVFEEIVN
ncbi:uncharacterized protein LOC128492747 [Spea bombifrons]|uniref:uncharacterized protein LOC128492747 n=1 Tax=Spea bombifrons TaxID=233779 RepID=UPI0023499646|nr:uncharacterized protein LOC128492747 [Spea bombifrons]